MNLIKRLETFLFNSRTCWFVSVIVAISWLKTGIWNMPGLLLQMPMAVNPFENPFSDQLKHYLFWNWLGPFIAWCIHATSPYAFAAFFLACSFAFTALFMTIAVARFPRQQARKAIILFVALPASGTIYFWVGMDSLTLLLMLTALAWPKRAWLVAVAGMALGMQHFEQGVVAASALALMVTLARSHDDVSSYSWRFCVSWMMGIILGKGTLYVIFFLNGVIVNSGRVHWIAVFLPTLLSSSFLQAQYILWSVLGVAWLAALQYSDQGRRARPFFIALAALTLMLSIMEDQTRVAAIVSFPIITAAWLFNIRFLAGISTQQSAFFFFVWMICPWAWVWRGIPRWSEAPYELVFMLRAVFGILRNVPMDSMLGPL